MRSRVVLVLVLVICSSGLLASCTSESSAREDGVNRVAELFEELASGRYAEMGFPALDWADVPALLDRGQSKRELHEFPRNPDSSQYESRCREGIVALWLVEGLRQGGCFPSNNALCFSGPVDGSDWTGASEVNHGRLFGAYRAWWDEVGKLPKARAVAVDPLAGTGLSWH